MKESLELTEWFKVTPKMLYDAWLSSEGHSDMTGGEAFCSNQPGNKFSAWDGYIEGENIELETNTKIVQTWRTSEFDENDEDSLLTIHLKPLNGGTELTLIHTNIPEGQTQYKAGWIDHYFTPMRAYFN